MVIECKDSDSDGECQSSGQSECTEQVDQCAVLEQDMKNYLQRMTLEHLLGPGDICEQWIAQAEKDMKDMSDYRRELRTRLYQVAGNCQKLNDLLAKMKDRLKDNRRYIESMKKEMRKAALRKTEYSSIRDSTTTPPLEGRTQGIENGPRYDRLRYRPRATGNDHPNTTINGAALPEPAPHMAEARSVAKWISMSMPLTIIFFVNTRFKESLKFPQPALKQRSLDVLVQELNRIPNVLCLCYKNVTLHEMRRRLKELGQLKSTVRELVVYVGTHGKDNCICDINGDHYQVANLQKVIKERIKADNYRLVIEACREKTGSADKSSMEVDKLHDVPVLYMCDDGEKCYLIDDDQFRFLEWLNASKVNIESRGLIAAVDPAAIQVQKENWDLQKKEKSYLQKKMSVHQKEQSRHQKELSRHFQKDESKHLQEEKSVHFQKEESSHLQKEENSHLQKEKRVRFQKEESSDLQMEKGRHIQKEENMYPQKEEKTYLQKKEHRYLKK